MFFKPSLILLFVGIYASAIAVDLEEYDIDTLRNMLRSQTVCPVAYSNYINNCTAKYNKDIKQCRDDESAAKSRLKDESLESRRKYIAQSVNSCKVINACDDDHFDVVQIFACLSKQGSQTAASMNIMSYEANKLQNNYNVKVQKIENVKSSCTNSSTWELSLTTNAGISELNDCFSTGKWTLYLPTESPASIE